jgi:hypothetical protein
VIDLPRRAVFARELLELGPWRTPAELRRAHQRGVLLEHEHWDWLGGLRIYYPRPGCDPPHVRPAGSRGRGELPPYCHPAHQKPSIIK